jgi:hypothetical protein
LNKLFFQSKREHQKITRTKCARINKTNSHDIGLIMTLATKHRNQEPQQHNSSLASTSYSNQSRNEMKKGMESNYSKSVDTVIDQDVHKRQNSAGIVELLPKQTTSHPGVHSHEAKPMNQKENIDVICNNTKEDLINNAANCKKQLIIRSPKKNNVQNSKNDFEKKPDNGASNKDVAKETAQNPAKGKLLPKPVQKSCLPRKNLLDIEQVESTDKIIKQNHRPLVLRRSNTPLKDDIEEVSTQDTEEKRKSAEKIKPQEKQSTKVKQTRTSPQKPRLSIASIANLEVSKDRKAIHDFFGTTTFQRGNEYFVEGHIWNMKIQEEIELSEGIKLFRLSSNCWGTAVNAYTQDLLFIAPTEQEPIQIQRSKCTCPVAVNCKHGCASILKYMDCVEQKKPFPTSNILIQKQDRILQELADVKSSFSGLMQELSKSKEDIAKMRKQVEALRVKVETLETIDDSSAFEFEPLENKTNAVKSTETHKLQTSEKNSSRQEEENLFKFPTPSLPIITEENERVDEADPFAFNTDCSTVVSAKIEEIGKRESSYSYMNEGNVSDFRACSPTTSNSSSSPRKRKRSLSSTNSNLSAEYDSEDKAKKKKPSTYSK